MPCKLHHFLLFLFFSCFSLSAQGLRVDVGHSDFRIRNLHFANYPERNVKVTYSTFESPRKYYNELFFHEVFYDQYYFFHLRETPKLADRNASKDIILMPEYKVVVSKAKGVLVFTPYTNFFKNGGFTKTGKKKTIHGVAVEKYRLSPSFLDMEIWVGTQEKSNRITDFLHELNLLDGIPKEKKVIAVVNNTIEYGTEFIRYREERKGWLKSKFDRLLSVSEAVEQERDTCYEASRMDTIPVSTLKNIPKTTKLKYKSEYKTSFKTFYGKSDAKIDAYTAYWDDKSAMYLQLYDVTDTEGEKFIFLQNEKTALKGRIENDTFQVEIATKQTKDNCSVYGTPVFIKKHQENGRELSMYMTSDARAGNICTLVIDEKSDIDTSYLFDSYNLPKGEVIKLDIFTRSYRYTSEIKTVKESKKIKIDVKN
ncbi:hypothetical protein KORDIASMS9_02655 [Kordia sp. SMS9]|uniref:hypothetical protein n=1 Tax=Kordia sp. SMS9 TaxID=2282170 RepID=UPI000E10B10B|nr:hypothetical protein [Kordia sp. SMS9]AXG70415.1 hypothetical protein KORDIASMS9_02655 [Kordia sp. SMS9]